jgi:hypothetical protein
MEFVKVSRASGVACWPFRLARWLELIAKNTF